MSGDSSPSVLSYLRQYRFQRKTSPSGSSQSNSTPNSTSNSTPSPSNREQY